MRNDTGKGGFTHARHPQQGYGLVVPVMKFFSAHVHGGIVAGCTIPCKQNYRYPTQAQKFHGSGKNCVIPLFLGPDAVIIRGRMPLDVVSTFNIELLQE